MKKHGVTTLVQEGDFFDNRNSLRMSTIKMTEEFLRLLEEYEVHMILPLGNHDVAYKNTNELNSPELVFKDHPNVTVVSKNTTFVIHGTSFDFIPWINSQNQKETLEFMENTDSKYCVGHFDVLGGVFQKGGTPSHEGINVQAFSRYDLVFSGHFHTKSLIGNVLYTGTPFEYTWADWNDPKGFHLFNLETEELTFIENPDKIFHKIQVRDKELKIIPAKQGSFKDRYIKIEIDQDNTKILERMVQKIQEDQPADIQTIIKTTELQFDNFEHSEDMTMEKLLVEYVSNLEITDNKKKLLKELMVELYNTAENGE